jgi:nucleotide-binding universal stress UspA family protein
MQPIGELHLHRLLVAIDGSASSELALSAAVTAARRDHAALTLVSVAPDIMAEASRWPSWGGAYPCDQVQVDAGAERALREAAERVPDDIPVTRVVRRGRAGPEIVAHAAEQPYDAILMGARGVGRVGALMGSVSSYVLHHANTAVFVAHAPREGSSEPNAASAA